MPTTEHLTVSQAARILGLSAERVRQLASTGRLASIVTPLGRLFAVADVERLVERRRISQLREGDS
jgi:excisionase family DNA binding protein